MCAGGAPSIGQQPPVGCGGAAAPPIQDAVTTELQELVAIGEARSLKRFVNRSWEHTQHAQNGKRMRQLEAKNASLKKAAEDNNLALAVAAFTHKDVSSIIAESPKHHLNGLQVAVLDVHVACEHTIRGTVSNMDATGAVYKEVFQIRGS